MPDEGGHRAALAELPVPRFVSMASHRLRPRAVRYARSVIGTGLAAVGSQELDAVAEAHAYTGESNMLRVLVDAALLQEGSDTAPLDFPGFAAYRIGYLIRAASLDESFSDDEVVALLRLAHRLAAELREDTAPALDVSCARVALSGYLGELSGLDPVAAVAALRSEAESNLTAEQVHRSGSPGAHIEVLKRLAAVLEAGLTMDAGLIGLRYAMEEALAWMVAPDGSLLEIGGTRPRLIGGVYAGYSMGPQAMESVYRHPALLHAATAGGVGMAPLPGWRVFPDAGIAVCKTGWPTAIDQRDGAAYFAIQGDSGFRVSDDDLNIVWFDAARWLLTGPGHGPDPAQQVRPDQQIRNGANDDDGRDIGGGRDGPSPEDVAAFAWTRPAHNVADVESPSDERSYRSGFVGWGMRRGVHVLEAESEIGVVEHRRTIAMVPGAWLLVADTLTGPAEPGRRRWGKLMSGPTATLWFHAAPDLDVLAGAGSLVMASAGDPVAWVTQLGSGWKTISPERGRRRAPLQGWVIARNGRPRPAWAFGWSARTPARSAVLFTLDGPAAPETGGEESTAWSTAGGRVEVVWSEIGIAELSWSPESS